MVLQLPDATDDETHAAYHLAGQAVVAWLSGVPIEGLQITPHGAAIAAMTLPEIGSPITVSRPVAHTSALIKLAGLIAVDVYGFGHAFGVQAINFLDFMSTADREAYEEAARLIAYVQDDSRTQHVNRTWSNVQTVCCLPRHWRAIEAVANALLWSHKLIGLDAELIISRAVSAHTAPVQPMSISPTPTEYFIDDTDGPYQGLPLRRRKTCQPAAQRRCGRTLC